MERKIIDKVRGFRTTDGAGVSLVRVLGGGTVEQYNPILMLDSFDSINPDEYTAGFPMHPHRGIETISYLYKGKMIHKDSLGNTEEICDREVQWMTAGSGIMHEEQVPSSERLLGVQLWLNMPAKEKMSPPAYHSIRKNDIEEIPFNGGKIRLLAGYFVDENGVFHEGYQGKHTPIDYYDVHLNPGASLEITTKDTDSVMAFTLLGDAIIAGEKINEKTAVKFSNGNKVIIEATDLPAQVLFISSKELKEPVVWGGPIVMNTEDELHTAFRELREGTFLKDEAKY